MTTEIRILIADDHDIVRAGLRKAIAAEPQLKIIAEVEDYTTALEIIEQSRPEIAILDLHMPESKGGETKAVGFDLARIIQREHLPTRVIFLTYDDRGATLKAARELGVKGYVLKTRAEAEIVIALRAVQDDILFISPQLFSHLERHSSQVLTFLEEYPGLRDLTRQELKVLKLLINGQNAAETASELGIQEHTVNNYRREVCQKLWLHGPYALTRFVLKYKFELTQFFAELSASDDQ
jgi:DNA-binding NarL/FixJ family response regulator